MKFLCHFDLGTISSLKKPKPSYSNVLTLAMHSRVVEQQTCERGDGLHPIGILMNSGSKNDEKTGAQFFEDDEK